MKAKKNENGLHPHKILVLKSVRAGGNTTITSLATKTRLNGRAAYHAIYHLRKDGYIKINTVDLDGKKENHYALTPKGSKAL